MAVGLGELVGWLGLQQHTLRKAGLLAEKGPDMAALALDEMVRQSAAVAFIFCAGQIFRKIGQACIQQRQQGAEGILLAAVGRGGDQDEVPGGIPAESLDQLMALVLAAIAFAGKGAGVCFIDDDKFRAAAQKIVPVAVGFDKIGGDHDEGIMLKEGFARAALLLQAACRVGQYQLGGDMEFLLQFALPLFGQLRRAQDSDSVDLAALQQLAGDEAGLDGLADADIVSDEQTHGIEPKGHEQRCQLIRTRLNRNLAERAEGAGAGAKTDAQGIAKQMTRVVVSQLSRIGEVEPGRLNFFQGGEDAGDFILGAAKRPHHQELCIRAGQDHPFPAARLDQRSDRIVHVRLPKIQGYWRRMGCHSPVWLKRMTVMPRSARAASCSVSRCRRSG